MRNKALLKSSLFASLVLSLASSTACSRRNRDAPHQLLGKWKLSTVGGKAPSVIQIDAWQVEFKEAGSWEFSGTMTGKYQGMTIKGSGTWTLRGSELDYSAGAHKGSAEIEVGKGSLVIHPDPVIRVNGTEPVDTSYTRLP